MSDLVQLPEVRVQSGETGVGGTSSLFLLPDGLLIPSSSPAPTPRPPWGLGLSAGCQGHLVQWPSGKSAYLWSAASSSQAMTFLACKSPCGQLKGLHQPQTLPSAPLMDPPSPGSHSG